MMRIHKTTILRRTATITIGLVVMFFGVGNAQVFAAEDNDCSPGMSQLDCDSLLGDWISWVPEDTPVCSSGTATNGAIIPPAGQNQGTWNSGLQPPYILEQFMIELLKDIAQKEGASADGAVTQQHIIGLIAFAWGEGGGITNDTGFWNPFNTGINAPDLTVGGAHSTSGLQSFKSFDAGVEATARVMTGPYQGRLGVILTDPNSTATQFIQGTNSLTDFPSPPPASGYPTGHYPWAEASDPSSKYYQKDYIPTRLKLVAQVSSNYNDMASLVMRGSPSDPGGVHNQAKLKYHTNASAAAATSCTGSGFFGVAKSYAWPKYTHAPYCVMRKAYADAVQAALNRKGDYVGGGSSTLPPVISDASDTDPVPDKSLSNCSEGTAGIDCGGFVTRVFRDSGADPHYNQEANNVVAQHDYVKSHPELYQKLSGVQSASQLQPGDIFFSASLDHTYIFVGDAGYPGYNAVSASFSTTGQSWRTPMASPAYDFPSAMWYRPVHSLTSTTTPTTVPGTNGGPTAQ